MTVKSNIDKMIHEVIKEQKTCTEGFIRKKLDIGSTAFRINISKLLNGNIVTRIGKGKEANYAPLSNDIIKVVYKQFKENTIVTCSELMERCCLTRLQVLNIIDKIIEDGEIQIYRHRTKYNNSIHYSLEPDIEGYYILGDSERRRRKERESKPHPLDMGTIDKTYLRTFLNGQMSNLAKGALK